MQVTVQIDPAPGCKSLAAFPRHQNESLDLDPLSRLCPFGCRSGLRSGGRFLGQKRALVDPLAEVALFDYPLREFRTAQFA